MDGDNDFEYSKKLIDQLFNNNYYINLNLGQYNLQKLPNNEDNQFKLGFLFTQNIYDNINFLSDIVIGFDSVFKMYFYKKLAIYFITTFDYYGSSIPLGFCILGINNEENISEFLRNFILEINKIKSIRKLRFMTDYSIVQISALNRIIKEFIQYDIKWFTCKYHLFSSWLKKISKLNINNTNLFYDLKKLTLCYSQDNFNIEYNKLLNTYCNNIATRSFFNYFKTYYIPNKESWTKIDKLYNFFLFNTNKISESIIKISETIMNKSSKSFNNVITVLNNTFILKHKLNITNIYSKTIKLYNDSMFIGYELLL